jgi:plastocyanin
LLTVYSPNNLTVKAGTPITVKNHDAIPYTVASTADGADVQSPTASDVFDTGVMMMNREAQITIDEWEPTTTSAPYIPS